MVESATLTPEERLARLPAVLDCLAVAVHDITFDFDESDYPDPPDRDDKTTRQVVGPGFPTLGYYNVPLSITREIGESKMVSGIGSMTSRTYSWISRMCCGGSRTRASTMGFGT